MYDYHKLVLFLLFFSLSHGATLFPSTLVTSSGSASSTPLTALRTQDQSGSQDTWNNYVEFYGSSKAYAGVLTFSTAALDARAVSSFTVQANFKGPTVSAQKWTFEFYDNVNKVWILFGDNTGVASWVWSPITLRSGSTAFSSLVSNGQVQLRFSSASKGDDCDLDYLAIVTTESSAPAPSTPAPSSPPVGATVRPTTPTTKPATPAPTTKPTTAAPTTKPATAAPVTAAPTTKPATAAPTTKPATAAPTTKPATAAPGGRICPAGQVWAPAPGTTWQWQLTGTIDTSLDVQMYDIDLFDTAASTITTLHGKGRVVICYFSTQYENWRPDASKFTSDVLGNNLDDWPGERYVDIRSSKIRQIMSERLDLAVSKGCDGVEPDNVDGYSNNNGLGLTANDQLDYNKFLANEAHKRGLSIGLKNDLAQVNALVSSFDWALNEQCNEYKECSALNPFVTAGKAVFGVEYTGSASTFCPAMVTAKFSWWLKNLNLGAGGTQCCTYASGGCAAKATYRCASYSSKRTIDGQEEYVLDEAAESPVNPPELPEAQVVEAQVVEAQAVEASAASYTVVSAVAVVAAVAAMVL